MGSYTISPSIHNYIIIIIRKMLTSAPGALIKQLNMVNIYWNLYNLFFKIMNYVDSNTKFACFGFFN
jgi:hypothetical protein